MKRGQKRCRPEHHLKTLHSGAARSKAYVQFARRTRTSLGFVVAAGAPGIVGITNRRVTSSRERRAAHACTSQITYAIAQKPFRVPYPPEWYRAHVRRWCRPCPAGLSFPRSHEYVPMESYEKSVKALPCDASRLEVSTGGHLSVPGMSKFEI